VGARQQREPEPDRAGVLPKGVPISSDTAYLAMVASDINDRPSKIHDWKKPSEKFAELVEANASTD
jgi:IS30 family transposase